jgi:hypothetical protein
VNRLDENEIITAVCSHLERKGFTVKQRLHTTEQGVDIIAIDPTTARTHYIEAKGGTSSRDGSARFGKEYTQSQVFDRVAKGVFTALELRAAHPNRETEVVCLAVPDVRFFRRYLTPVAPQLAAAGLQVLFVSADHSVANL